MSHKLEMKLRQEPNVAQASRLARTTVNDSALRFAEAVRAYDSSATRLQRIATLELIIRASRNIENDDRSMPEEVRTKIEHIERRFELFGALGVRPTLTTFRQARRALRNLFF
jgi:hypothetical protein